MREGGETAGPERPGDRGPVVATGVGTGVGKGVGKGVAKGAESGVGGGATTRVTGLVTATALVALAGLVQWPLFDRAVVPMDEGHLAAAADWMLDGRRLYVDIHTGIFPGIYLVASGLFAVFGRDLIVTRLAAAAVQIVSVLALWSVARRVVRPAFAWIPPLLQLALVAFAFPVLSMFNYSTLSLAFGLVGLVFLLRYLERGRGLDGACLGLAVAASALTKQNFGALVFVALWAGLAWGRRGSALDARGPVAALVPIGAAGAGLTAAVVLFFLAQGSLGALVDSTVLSLGGSQLEDFDNPIPPILGPHPDDGRFTFLYSPPALFNAWVHGEAFLGVPIGPLVRSLAIRLSYGVPIATLLAALVWLVRTRRAAATPRRRATRAVAVFALVFAPGIFPSAIWSHLAFVLPPIALLAAIGADRVSARLAARAADPPAPGARALRRAWRVAGALVALGLAALAVASARNVVRWNTEPLGLARASVRVPPRDRDLLRGAVDFVEACAAPGEPILALPDIPIVWFLTDRPNPSPYDLTIPGRVDGGLIVERMRAAGVRCVVMNPRMYPEFPPFRRLFPGLARALERDFRGERVIAAGDARWIGLTRRAGGAPPATR